MYFCFGMQVSQLTPVCHRFALVVLTTTTTTTEIMSDPSYPGQWRLQGEYIEQIARMTHWEYPKRWHDLAVNSMLWALPTNCYCEELKMEIL
jgi:hypothetical protein